jgi:signal transduction histidine kinase
MTDSPATTQRLIRLLDLSARLNQKVEPTRLLQFIIWTAADVLGCEAASILLYDAENDRLRFVAATGADPKELARIAVPINDSLAGTIFREGRAVRTETAESDERHFNGVDRHVSFQTRSLLGVPMRIGEDRIGVLEVLNKIQGPFTEEDELLLGIIADQAAVAIRNARQMESLRRANSLLARSEEARSRFLVLASHALRTPLSIVAGYADALRAGSAEEAGALSAEASGAIADACATMTRVIDAMHEVDRLHAGVAALELRPLPVEELLAEATRTVASVAEAKNVRLRLKEVPAGTGVRGDRTRLGHALVSLLENAIRHTPPGGVVAVHTSERGGGLLIEVIDTGCGLEPENFEAVFQDFFQVEESLTRTHEGLGLGLPIARGIAELHGGRLWVHSDGIGRGATFALWLPALSPLPSPALRSAVGIRAGRRPTRRRGRRARFVSAA